MLLSNLRKNLWDAKKDVDISQNAFEEANEKWEQILQQRLDIMGRSSMNTSFASLSSARNDQRFALHNCGAVVLNKFLQWTVSLCVEIKRASSTTNQVNFTPITRTRSTLDSKSSASVSRRYLTSFLGSVGAQVSHNPVDARLQGVFHCWTRCDRAL